jgi:hypothetical protein
MLTHRQPSRASSTTGSSSGSRRHDASLPRPPSPPTFYSDSDEEYDSPEEYIPSTNESEGDKVVAGDFVASDADEERALATMMRR